MCVTFREVAAPVASQSAGLDLGATRLRAAVGTGGAALGGLAAARLEVDA